ncbi:MAG: hypothetical protein ABS79_00920 [Planctomycetes bacterium SCN 63-9]|nr:MAG: hypothetical protein ABS79_00920 [Planctomycetes bacterium SCN 63-9]
MPKHSSTPKRPRDPNQLAELIVGIATGEAPDEPTPSLSTEPTEPAKPEKDPAAVSLGRRGGLKGGKARAASMTPEQRSEIAKKAATKRWNKD